MNHLPCWLCISYLAMKCNFKIPNIFCSTFILFISIILFDKLALAVVQTWVKVSLGIVLYEHFYSHFHNELCLLSAFRCLIRTDSQMTSQDRVPSYFTWGLSRQQHNTWFYRLPVVQEIALASILHVYFFKFHNN